jgi:hypothetical protein
MLCQVGALAGCIYLYLYLWFSWGKEYLLEGEGYSRRKRMSKPLIELEELSAESVARLLLSLGAEKIAVFSEGWELLFAHPTREDGDSLKSIGASLSAFLDESSPWLFLRREERTVVLIKAEKALVVVEGDIKPSDADLVVLLGKLLVE